MAKKVMQQEMTAENVGVINPFALAEVLLNRPVEWENVDVQKTLSETFDMPYEKLFDPIYESPLYTGLEFNTETMVMERAEPPVVETGLPELGSESTTTDAEAFLTDADLGFEDIGVAQALAGVSATATWQDPGVFFKEAAEMADPVQGALGDCYFIAALSSVAWARTYDIAHRSRATGTSQQQFVDMVMFYDNGKAARVEVSEQLPLNPPANYYIYARSKEQGEIWPAVYEKAYAKWRTHTASDHPNYAPIAGGDPVGALAQLTGLNRTYYWTSQISADDIWHRVRQNCISRKTFNPMVAWTYPSGEASPDKVNYNNAHLVANHAYSILGWDYRNGQKYVVIRNPWGSYEATMGVTGGHWYAWDAPYYGGPGWWRPVNLPSNDGIFALRADIFKKFYAGFGLVK